MSLDPLTFTPPSLDDLTDAVERAQRTASRRFFSYLRRNSEPTSAEFAGEVRGLRHLTAIHRTLHQLAGPVFDPRSPLSADHRLELVKRRLRLAEQAFDASHPGFDPDSQSPESLPGGFEPPALSGVDPAYIPPEIAELLGAVDMAQKVASNRWSNIQTRPLDLTTVDFELELLALRDLTAINRTLRRMSGEALPEDDSAADLERELELGSSAATSVHRPAGPDENGASDQAASVKSVAEAGLDASSSFNPGSESPESVADGFCSEEPVALEEMSSLPERRPIRPVPPVPEIHPITSSRASHPRHSARAPQPRGRASRSSGRRNCLTDEFPEIEPGPWGNYSTPPMPGHRSVDEVAAGLPGAADDDLFPTNPRAPVLSDSRPDPDGKPRGHSRSGPVPDSEGGGDIPPSALKPDPPPD